MKKNDFILVGILLVICALSLLLFKVYSTDGAYVIIKQDGEIVKCIPLNKDTRIRIPETGDAYNIVETHNGRASITDADCPDLICKKHSAISKTGESITCLPHKLSIIIHSSSPENKNEIDSESS